MKTKLLLRFYFHADGVERAIDNLILAVACGGGRAEPSAEKIISLCGYKDELAELWRYLDGVISRFGGEAEVLRGYCEGRRGGDEKRLKRVVMRFRRRAEGAARFVKAQELLKKYAVFCRSR